MPASFRPLSVAITSPLRPFTVALVVVVLGACASNTRAPVEDRRALQSRAPVAAAPEASRQAAGTPPAAGSAEPDWRPPNHTVKRGDTLHQIALDYGLDYRELAGWNNLENPNLIRVGQVLRLTAPGEPPGASAGAAAAPGVTVAPLRTLPPVIEARPGAPSIAAVAPSAAPLPPLRNSATYKSSPKAMKEPYSEQAMRDIVRAGTAVSTPPPETLAAAAPSAPLATAPSTAPSPPRVEPKSESPKAESSKPDAPPAGEVEGDDRINWMWPSKGRVVGNFSETANLKGIDIAGTSGQPVVASASGTVVYAGSGLRGYGKLIIIKHNKTFLSAYAHNRDILVKEGQVVGKGDKIAEMGNTDTADVKLHFEIRRLGKPMDPARYLPPA